MADLALQALAQALRDWEPTYDGATEVAISLASYGAKLVTPERLTAVLREAPGAATNAEYAQQIYDLLDPVDG